MADSLQTLKGRKGAFVLHATHDPRETTRAARDAFNARFAELVDPDGVLDPTERARRAQYARKAYYTDLALKSAKARRKRAD
jgi:hypothetical protein